MRQQIRVGLLLLVVLAPSSTAVFAPGIARPALPPMGWRSWNVFQCNISQLIMQQQMMVIITPPSFAANSANKSLFDLGYTHAGLDDCWQDCSGPNGSFHDATSGKPIIDTTKFPSLSGMAAFGTRLGLSVGFYGDNCRCHEKGLQTHYGQDVDLAVSSGFAGLKIDSCGNQRDMTVYANELADRNASFLVESCGNGPAGTNPKYDIPPLPEYLFLLEDTCPWSFYRVSIDVGPQFFSTVYNANRALPFLNKTRPLSRPGCYAYADMLEVGNTPTQSSGLAVMTFIEWQTHFALWAVISSPLILGFDLTDAALMESVWPIIANEEVLAISQVFAGHPGWLVENSTKYKDCKTAHDSTGTRLTIERMPSYQVWAKPVTAQRSDLDVLNGAPAPATAIAVLVVKVWDSGAPSRRGSVSIPLEDLFDVFGKVPDAASVRDVHAHVVEEVVNGAWTVDLDSIQEHGSKFVVLTPSAA